MVRKLGGIIKEKKWRRTWESNPISIFQPYLISSQAPNRSDILRGGGYRTPTCKPFRTTAFETAVLAIILTLQKKK